MTGAIVMILAFWLGGVLALIGVSLTSHDRPADAQGWTQLTIMILAWPVSVILCGEDQDDALD